MEKGFVRFIIYLLIILLALGSFASCREAEDIAVSASPRPTASFLFPAPFATKAPLPSPPPTPEPSPTPEPTEAPTPEPTPLPDGHEALTDEEKTALINFENRLPKNYVPHDLVYARDVMGESCALNHRYIQIQFEVAMHLKEMFEAAYAEGVTATYLINSAYRTMGDQWRMWNKKLESHPHYGDDPYENHVAVMPGDASEHVAGLALDLASLEHPRENEEFGETEEGIWLRENAHRFGFILRYPENKCNITGVKYEPWHFRYVGVGLAEEIYESGLCLEEHLARNGR